MTYLSKQPIGTLITIFQNTSLDDIAHTCMTSRELYNKVCLNADFWKQFYPTVEERNIALANASMLGLTGIMRGLLNAKAALHAFDDLALRICSKLSGVLLLLENGANVHAGNEEALRIASTRGRTKIVQLLLSKGANVHANDDESLQNASSNGHADIVAMLVKKRANVHASGDFALYMACLCGHYKVVQILLNAGADVHIRNDECLQIAIRGGHMEIVILLLQGGINIKKIDLLDAIDSHRSDIVLTLLHAGAPFDIHIFEHTQTLYSQRTMGELLRDWIKTQHLVLDQYNNYIKI